MKRILIIVVVLICSCSNPKEEQSDRLFSLLKPSQTQIKFENTIDENDSINAIDFAYVYNGAGIGILDVNNDGLEDIFFAGNVVENKLYLNKGNFEFEDISKNAGIISDRWANGVTIIDINNDGFEDIYLSNSGPYEAIRRGNELYLNNGDNTFTEVAKDYGVRDEGYSTFAVFFDFDKDGDSDLYVLNSDNDTDAGLTYVKPKISDGSSESNDRLYLNENGRFRDISAEAGITIEGYGLGVLALDINNDSWLDLYVSNDFLFDDIIYINNKDGTFTDQSARLLSHTSQFGMGIDFADLNDDGYSDIIQLDMKPMTNVRQKKKFGANNYDFFQKTVAEGYMPQYMRNTLQLNNRGESFSEIGQYSGVDATDWSWAPLFADYDNDGLIDLYVTNGFKREITDFDFRLYVSQELSKLGRTFDNEVAVSAVESAPSEKITNIAYRNINGLQFADSTKNWGLDFEGFSNGAVYSDLDNDGDLDLIVNNIDEPAYIFRNNTSIDKSEYIQFTIEGLSNSESLGTVVTIYMDGNSKRRVYNPYRGYQSTVSDIIHFGVGDADKIDSVVVQWPDETITVKTSLSANQRVLLKKEETRKRQMEGVPKTMFSKVDIESKGIEKEYKPSGYVDFKKEPLLTHKLSNPGPAFAKGDMDGNGLEDIFIGGSSGVRASIYMQHRTGFKKKELAEDSRYEDAAAMLFDADGDGDLDLYIASGGNQFSGDSVYLNDYLWYRDRIYFNDGKGNFSERKEAIPAVYASSSCIVTFDYDNDGDLDLFIGGRVAPQQYPLPGRTSILENNQGVFEDVTTKLSEDLASVGMITSAVSLDYDGDEFEDLAIVGEFMPITFYKNINGERFENVTSELGLDGKKGWWNSIKAVDIDNDGDSDLFAGNLGLNNVYDAGTDQPLRMYAKDCDRNGSIDPILSYYINGEESIGYSKNTLSSQMASIRQAFPRHLTYAQKEFSYFYELFKLDDAYKLEANHFSSIMLLNEKGSFSEKPLPPYAQFSPINDFLFEDLNADGLKDVIAVGNSYAPNSFVGSYDAMGGFVLMNNGQDFDFISGINSGFSPTGEVRRISKINMNGQDFFLTLSNNRGTAMFMIK
ncbi:MAG: VCBS repeat-containing protein [Cyclobacteriaceae bacterium]